MSPDNSTCRTVTVELGDRSYPIAIGDGILSGLGERVRGRVPSHDAVVISDSTVARLYLSTVSRELRRSDFRVTAIVFPAGERQKNIGRVMSVITSMMKKRIGRTSFVAALGGGVVGDIAGFVAAVYQRGVDFVQIPTTLLAQVDSSVGGTVGVNHPAGKNMIGAFHQPRLVVADSGVLATLPRRELVCGMGEVIKYGVIADAEFFRELERRSGDILGLDPDAVGSAVARCCSIKAAVVEGDEREQAPSEGRAVLNFGHTVGHAVESALRYRNIRHGEAVLLGMLVESRIAARMGMLAREDERRIDALIRLLPLPRVLPGLSPGLLCGLMAHDKKVRDGKIRFVLPTAIGCVRTVDNVPRTAITRSINEIANTFARRPRK